MPVDSGELPVYVNWTGSAVDGASDSFSKWVPVEIGKKRWMALCSLSLSLPPPPSLQLVEGYDERKVHEGCGCPWTGERARERDREK